MQNIEKQAFTAALAGFQECLENIVAATINLDIDMVREYIQNNGIPQEVSEKNHPEITSLMYNTRLNRMYLNVILTPESFYDADVEEPTSASAFLVDYADQLHAAVSVLNESGVLVKDEHEAFAGMLRTILTVGAFTVTTLTVTQPEGRVAALHNELFVLLSIIAYLEKQVA